MGLGYIGLPTASLLASKGFQVHGVDVSPQVVETINAGHIHIREPALDILVKSAVQSGRLTAHTEPAAADIFILAVPTPFKDDFEPDLRYVEDATRAIAPYLAAGNLVILESTSPVGTTEKVAAWIADARPDLVVPRRGIQEIDVPESVHVAHCPERVLPGQIIRELVDNDRIVGGIDEASTAAAADFYRHFVAGEVLETDSRTAELAKLTENTFRDVNIALANELSQVCDHLGVDVWDLIQLSNRHPRVNVLRPGPGVGGHCIAVDPWFIVHSAPEQARLIRMAREVNAGKPEQVVAKVRAKAARFQSPTIACLGLTYKPDIDDLRESPALYITAQLGRAQVGRVLAVEPHVDSLPTALQDTNVRLCGLDIALNEADIVLGLVAHRGFRKVSRQTLQEKIVIDTCGIWR
ncbi:UDP-N-acetyl-D-mannosamine dehydrogenase [Thiorhodococcus minor]|uniref:UDP-N-acetyl-D-mannosamine dehydrogenase n=2 Tax=Thiorhodococcus minor TaxID=57489 RepID=A0A6M0K436_9GAMM|nr:UDP-N-acetyl-D-mannosamine dehydrogenase [Thiorhodococcus minor]NEV63683.1 UDP-N-acetyl-D-mannosamine dehydrogenase [Thiorhodococcus minor]